MNDSDACRVLLLERLESRCLLAAGIFSLSAPEDRTGRSVVEGHGERPALESQHRNRIQAFHIKGDVSQPFGNQKAVADRGAIEAQVDAIRPTPGAQLITITASAAQRSLNEGPGSSVVRTTPATRDATAASPTSILASVLASGRDSVLDSSGKPVQQSASLVTSVRAATYENLDIAARDASTMETMSESERASVDIRSIDPVAVSRDYAENKDGSGGTIETLPLLRRDGNALQPAEAEDPWEVDSQSLRRLREVTRSSADESSAGKFSPDNPNAASGDRIDRAIANWFGQSTGFVDDIPSNHVFPVISENLSPSMVDVVLDPSVGLHRSVGLIALADADASPTQIRDAILAAITNEQPIVSELTSGPAKTHLSGFAYSGAAIVAGTLVVATQRRKGGKLEMSRPGN